MRDTQNFPIKTCELEVKYILLQHIYGYAGTYQHGIHSKNTNQDYKSIIYETTKNFDTQDTDKK